MYNLLIKIPIVGNWIKKRELHKVTNHAICGKNILTTRASQVILQDGSTKEDVVIGNNVKMRGVIVSQNHGKVQIGNYTMIGANVHIGAVDSISIGDYTGIAINTHIIDNNNHPISPDFHRYRMMQNLEDDSHTWKYSAHAPIVIGENCWIGQNVRIQKGVSIGDNSIIAANSVVTKDVPANCIAAGNPAKVVKTDIDKIPAPTTCAGYNAYKSTQQPKS